MSMRKLSESYYGFQPIVNIIIINLKFPVLPLMARSERTSNFSISRERSTNHPFVGITLWPRHGTPGTSKYYFVLLALWEIQSQIYFRIVLNKGQVRWLNRVVTKPDDPSSITWVPVVEGENGCPQFSDLLYIHTMVCMPHVHRKQIKCYQRILWNKIVK